MASAAVWRFRCFVFGTHILVVGGILWLVSSISAPPQADLTWQELPLAERLHEPDYIAGGKALYDQYCVACHGENGHGGIGPDLTDDEWLHGGSLDDIIRSVSKGYPQQGMVGWEPILERPGVEQVSAYIQSISLK